MSAMITVEEALARVIASGAPPLEEEKVALEEAYGRVLVRDLKALRTQPPFPNSAMDGYALRAADTAPAPATLTVIGESAAGRAFEGRCRPGRGGAHLHRRADAGRRRLHRHSGGRRARGASASGFRARRRQATICVRPAWTSAKAKPSFRPAAASAPEMWRWRPRRTIQRSSVRRRARVAILATGDELVAPGGSLGPAQIIASNNFAVAGVVEAYGGVADRSRHRGR